MLAHTEPDSNPTTAATWMAVATINAATVQAAADDARPILLKWTTMHDQNVREAHEAADRQRRPAGSYFFVGGENLRYPGDPRGSIENTINCRCVLQPVPRQPDAHRGRLEGEHHAPRNPPGVARCPRPRRCLVR